MTFRILPRTIVRGLAHALALGLAATAFGPSASATPPDVVTIDDTLLAASSTHVFVLRSTSDNLGSHYAYRTETWLVSIDAQTGAETLWPLHAAVQSTEFGGEGEPDRKVVETDDNADAVDLFGTLAREGAVPLLARRGWGGLREVETRREGGSVVLVSDARTRYAMPFDAATAQVAASARALGEKVGDVRRIGSLGTRSVYRDIAFDADRCTFEALGWSLAFDAPIGPRQPVRVTCEDTESMGRISLIQLAPKQAAAAE